MSALLTEIIVKSLESQSNSKEANSRCAKPFSVSVFLRVDYYAYMKGLGELSHSVLNLLAEGIGLASTAFTTELQTGDEQGTMRFNYCPACPRPDKVWGLLAHRDTSMVSILHQDCVGGLQVNRHGEWKGVAPVPFSFVVNVGDVLKVKTPPGSLHSMQKDRQKTEHIKPRRKLL